MAGVSDAGTLEGDASAEEREAAVRDVIQTIARTTFDLDAVLQTVIDRAVRLCSADNGNIARRVDDKDEYRVAAFTSMVPEYERLVRERIYRPERGSILGRAILEKRVVHIPDVLEDPDYTARRASRDRGLPSQRSAFR
jgi:two-component system, NtrC family, sensor kinase